MSLASPRGSPKMAVFPRGLSSIVASVVGLAMFLIVASLLLVSYPIGSAVSGYFYGMDKRLVFPISPVDQSAVDHLHSTSVDAIDKNSSSGSSLKVSEGSSPGENVDGNAAAENLPPSYSDIQVPNGSDDSLGLKSKDIVEKSAGGPELSSRSTHREGADAGYVSSNETKSGSVDSKSKDIVGKSTESPELSSGSTQKEEVDTGYVSSNATKSDSVGLKSKDIVEKSEVAPESSSIAAQKEEDNAGSGAISSERGGKSAQKEDNASNATQNGSVESGCDLYHGNWFYDPLGPSYTNNTCPVLTQMQNCQGNGRPDKEYENWRWKPFQCDLPRFDAKKFLELMRGKTLAFVGDSVARNQMESMLCLLWQVEVPKNRGNRKMQRWYFRSTSVMIVRIWSSWLVHQTSEKFDFAPEGVTKLHLDVPDEIFMEFIPKFDVIVISSGHWFAKQSVYLLNNEIVGGQLWWPDKSRPRKINNIEAFGISVETSLSAIVTHPNFTGLTILRSYSPDHYEGGTWNTGGSCTGKVKPLALGELVENGFTDIMHKKQVMGFNLASKKATNKSKLRLMDITEVFGYRQDGHPGPYRNPDPNKITKRGPDGRPPPQDCLHWCMPGPVDTWNELVLEIIRREFEGNESFSS